MKLREIGRTIGRKMQVCSDKRRISKTMKDACCFCFLFPAEELINNGKSTQREVCLLTFLFFFALTFVTNQKVLTTKHSRICDSACQFIYLTQSKSIYIFFYLSSFTEEQSDFNDSLLSKERL